MASGLEKLTNANQSVRIVNDQIFPVELMETADWKSLVPHICYIKWGGGGGGGGELVHIPI